MPASGLRGDCLRRAAAEGLPYAYTQEDLPNGLRLITVPTDYANIVAVYIVVQTGSRNEVEPGHTGFAHLFEHLMFRGTPKYPAEKYNQTLNRIGAASNASTDDDLTVYHTTFSKEDLDDRARHGGRPLPEPEVRRARVQDREPGRAGRVQQEQRRSRSASSNEVLHDTAFDRHTYKHTTMGFLKDIQDMPNQYEYSLKFFDRYYRPEYTTIIVVGDVKAKAVRALVDKYWGEWKRGSYKPEIPVEPPQDGAAQRAKWTGPARPCRSSRSRSRPGVQRRHQGHGRAGRARLPGVLLHVRPVPEAGGAGAEGRCALRPTRPAASIPALFEIAARVKKAEDMDYVRDQILATVKEFQEKPVDAAQAGHGAQAPALSVGAEHGQQRHHRADSRLLRRAEANARRP